MNKIFSDLLKGVILIASLSQMAHASIITNDDYFAFDWAAICGDCNSAMGEFNEFENVEVTGSIVLSGYTPGEAFIIDDNNLVSFGYNGPSIHLDAFTLENNNSEPANIYQPGLQGVTGWIADDLSSFELDLYYTIWYIDDIIYYEKPDSAGTDGPSLMNVHFEQDASWAIDIEGLPWDFGVSAAIAPASNVVTDVPEPNTIAIFALSLMGLASRKFKKKHLNSFTSKLTPKKHLPFFRCFFDHKYS